MPPDKIPNPLFPSGEIRIDTTKLYEKILGEKIVFCFSHVRSYGDFKWDDQKSKANANKIGLKKILESIMFMAKMCVSEFDKCCMNAQVQKPEGTHKNFESELDWKTPFIMDDFHTPELNDVEVYQFGMGDFARFHGFFVGQVFVVRVIDPTHSFHDRYKKK